MLEEMGARTPENHKDLTPYIIRFLQLFSHPCHSLVPLALMKKRDMVQAGSRVKGKQQAGEDAKRNSSLATGR